ncbi:hypothetical protein [Roseomonas marmotae]|uniref:Uncharacterized protein n=1 Tax=Roseomonas marmotae TaxID=2768161 RepID=A0ABS3KEY2_9PROT|nr:hypothetical protein [Roseomonas marmotae]MBO1076009.1 hypothetical protein [Roseomonas marmotae]QTI80141.1 hypothetical protein IAI58_05080 [Roseomonas marmotae]
MALETLALPPAVRRRMTLDALAGLAQGGLAERLRLEAAARTLCTIHHVRQMVAEGALPGGLDVPAPARDWDPSLTTAREHAEMMTPAQIDRLLAEAPAWAEAILLARPAQRAA